MEMAPCFIQPNVGVEMVGRNQSDGFHFNLVKTISFRP